MGKTLDRYRLEYHRKKDCCVGGTRIIAFPMWAFLRWHTENGLDFFDDNYNAILHQAYEEDRDLAHLLLDVLTVCTTSVRADGGKGGPTEDDMERAIEYRGWTND